MFYSTANTSPQTGVRYGVISMNSIDPDVANELWHGSGAVDVSYQEAYNEAKVEAENKYDALEEEAYVAANETDYLMSDDERESFMENWFEIKGHVYDKEDFVDRQLEMFSDMCQIDEPNIEGTYEGVKYAISWLGGAPLLRVYEGPQGSADRLCSPCVPNAADLDSGFVLDAELEGGPEWEEIGVSEFDHENGFPCYCVPRDWLWKP